MTRALRHAAGNAARERRRRPPPTSSSSAPALPAPLLPPLSPSVATRSPWSTAPAGPTAKPCGELLTPRAVSAFASIGLGDQLDRFHRVTHVRLTTQRSTNSTRWPSHHDHPDHGFVVPREHLDAIAQGRAVEVGADLLRSTDAVAPIVDRGFVRGAHVTGPDGSPADLRATYTIVADGANSRFGRALGTYRDPTWPWALAAPRDLGVAAPRRRRGRARPRPHRSRRHDRSPGSAGCSRVATAR